MISLIQAIAGIAVAVIGGVFALTMKKAEERTALCIEENLLSMKMVSANIDLGIATGMAVRDGKTDGAMGRALEEASLTQREYQDFLKGVAARKIVGG